MSLHIITGCMFSGKTTALMTAYDECDTSKVLINHATDVRYSAEADVTTHDRRTRAARPCHRLRDVTAHEEYPTARAVFVDEAQFFPDLGEIVTRMVHGDAKHVTIAGLHSDFKRTKFGQLLDLMPIATQVTFLYARCAQCGARACFSQLRTDADDRFGQHRVGADDAFVAKCEEHYEPSV